MIRTIVNNEMFIGADYSFIKQTLGESELIDNGIMYATEDTGVKFKLNFQNDKLIRYEMKCVSTKGSFCED